MPIATETKPLSLEIIVERLSDSILEAQDSTCQDMGFSRTPQGNNIAAFFRGNHVLAEALKYPTRTKAHRQRFPTYNYQPYPNGKDADIVTINLRSADEFQKPTYYHNKLLDPNQSRDIFLRKMLLRLGFLETIEKLPSGILDYNLKIKGLIFNFRTLNHPSSKYKFVVADIFGTWTYSNGEIVLEGFLLTYKDRNG